jgi:hypothetical protein
MGARLLPEGNMAVRSLHKDWASSAVSVTGARSMLELASPQTDARPTIAAATRDRRSRTWERPSLANSPRKGS